VNGVSPRMIRLNVGLGKTRLRSSITASAFEKHIPMSKAWRGFAKR
jgi:hypothetical protein